MYEGEVIPDKKVQIFKPLYIYKVVILYATIRSYSYVGSDSLYKHN